MNPSLLAETIGDLGQPVSSAPKPLGIVTVILSRPAVAYILTIVGAAILGALVGSGMSGWTPLMTRARNASAIGASVSSLGYDIRVTIQCPQSVPLPSSCVLSAYVELVKLTVSGAEVVQIDPGSQSAPSAQLVMAGADVQPREPRRFLMDATLAWSVEPKQPKVYDGFIQIDETPSRVATSLGPTVEVHWPSRIPVSIECYEPALSKGSRYAALFLGSLLTLPGILTYLHHRKRRAAEQQMEAASTQSRIILPGAPDFRSPPGSV